MNPEWNALQATVLKATQQPVLVRSWQRDAVQLLLLHVGVAMAAVAMATFGLEHPPHVRLPSFLLLALTVVLMVIWAVAPASRARRWGLVALSTALAAAAAHVAAFSLGEESPFLANGGCAFAEVTIAALPGAATLMTLRTFAYHRARAVAAGLAAACTGWVVLDLTCPALGLAHALSFHVAPLALLVLVIGTVRARLASTTFVP